MDENISGVSSISDAFILVDIVSFLAILPGLVQKGDDMMRQI